MQLSASLMPRQPVAGHLTEDGCIGMKRTQKGITYEEETICDKRAVREDNQ